MDPETRAKAEKAIGYTFRDPALLAQALVHASISDSRLESNERLEFLGDAVLGLVACERIFSKFPDLLEGEMTKIKSTTVSRRTCADIANQLGIAEMLVIGKGMRVSGARPLSLAAAALEAVIAAIYLDAGYDACVDFLTPLLDPHIERAERSGHQQNFKSVLQQHAQQRLDAAPGYRVYDEQGPDHAKCFKVEVAVGGDRFIGGWGQSKKQAEQMAALTALECLGLIERTEAGEIIVVGVEDNGSAAPTPTEDSAEDPIVDAPSPQDEPTQADRTLRASEPEPNPDAADGDAA